MPTIEVDENEYAGMRNVTAAISKMLAHPEARRLVQQAQKTISPNTVIPEIDAAAPVLARIEALQKELDDERKARSEKETKAEEDKRLNDLRSRWDKGRQEAAQAGYTKDGLEALEKFMEERGIADHDIAIPAFEKINPPAVPIQSSPNRFDIFNPATRENDSALKMLFEGNDEGFLGTVIPQTLREMRGQR
jgi:hypothetical protein